MAVRIILPFSGQCADWKSCLKAIFIIPFADYRCTSQRCLPAGVGGAATIIKFATTKYCWGKVTDFEFNKAPLLLQRILGPNLAVAVVCLFTNNKWAKLAERAYSWKNLWRLGLLTSLMYYISVKESTGAVRAEEGAVGSRIRICSSCQIFLTHTCIECLVD